MEAIDAESLSTQEVSLIHNGAVAEGVQLPSVDEVYDAFEQEQELAMVISGDVSTWEEQQARAVRAAGHLGTEEGRRGMRERTFADREKLPFIGRYVGKAAVTPKLLEREYGSPDPNEVFYEATA